MEVSAMDPIEVREERVSTTTPAVPATPVVPAAPVVPPADAAPAERGFPVHGTEATAPVEQVPVAAAPVAAAPVAAAPVAAAPVAAAPVAPAAGTSVYSSRVGVYPIGYRAIQLIWLIAAVVDIILALNFIFRAANANNTGFAHYIRRLGGWLAAPFNGIFNNTATNGTVLRWSDVLAIAVYTVAAWIVTKLVRISATPRSGVNTV
ncbi:MAG: hypothetical protein DLM65_04050 [Candidatus Aeolococcus gillhamiae]|uniref:YggT family protein n=2 Tax=Candidatus Aeolococcus gillhamiae TaxID=3127015 RepID=A0A2W5ZAB7_9BACT|nr:MAG: hypothetical protein DLM65_04050 [Candidatus Dormibacter sp. RRmetagenome_bin12]